jgi:SAM-dependent methyltransferase
MPAPGSLAGLETFDELNIDYEKAYLDNEYKVACVKKAIGLLLPAAEGGGSNKNKNNRVLDVGCGTGMPVSELLSKAGDGALDVFGFDISPKMVEFASSRVRGTFVVSDMMEYQPSEGFAGVFMIFCHLQLSYPDFYAAAYKFAQMLEPGGLFVIGQMPGDEYVKEGDWDETKTYVDNYDAPFMGEMLPTLMLSAEGQLNFLKSMGLEIVSDQIDTFHPNFARSVPEIQQYTIARRPATTEPLPPPKPLPK